MLPVFKKINSNVADNFFGTSIFDDLFENNFNYLNVSVPAVNIAEGNENFRLEIAAPGLEKDDYKIALNNDLLTVSSERKNEKETKNEKFVKKEFSYSNFSRSFVLPDSVNSDLINASYKNGILSIVIPKKTEAVAKEPRQISIN